MQKPKYEAEAREAEEADVEEEVEELEPREGHGPAEADIDEINEAMRGEAGIAELSEPVGVRSAKTGELIKLQLERPEQLRQVIQTRNRIRAALARLYGKGDEV